jgi:hypothetical protein
MAPCASIRLRAGIVFPGNTKRQGIQLQVGALKPAEAAFTGCLLLTCADVPPGQRGGVPHGLTVVAGDDRIEPGIRFRESRFRQLLRRDHASVAVLVCGREQGVDIGLQALLHGGFRTDTKRLVRL